MAKRLVPVVATGVTIGVGWTEDGCMHEMLCNTLFTKGVRGRSAEKKAAKESRERAALIVRMFDQRDRLLEAARAILSSPTRGNEPSDEAVAMLEAAIAVCDEDESNA